MADDLSGAAECAAALAGAGGHAVPLILAGALPASGNYAVDTDTRAMDVDRAAGFAAQAISRAATGAGSAQAHLFKKIDSTLRGHVAAELGAALRLPNLLQAVVVCPALPEQGRILKQGVLYVHGEVQRDHKGQPADLCRMLQQTTAFPLLIENGSQAHPRQLAEGLSSGLARGARVMVVDAVTSADLDRLAEALLLLAPMRLLSVGSAGLAKALAAQILGPEKGLGSDAVRRPLVSDGPVVAVVGSFSQVSTAQVREISQDQDMDVIGLNANEWLSGTASREVSAAMAKAAIAVGRARSVVFAVAGTPAPHSTRALVQAMAAAAEPIIRQASTLVLTGGDTARAVLDRLRVERLEVAGEFEPGICISRQAGRHGPCIVTKAGGFGDSSALLRAMRHFARLRPANTILRESV